jgi:hypothetical protein
MRLRRLLLGSLAAGLLPVVLLPVAASAQETVTVGGVKKPAFGTPTQFTNGDTSCLVAFKDDRGASTIEPADFEICMQEKTLKGKRVAFTYKAGRVQAASCQGDPNCTKSDTVVLIVGAKLAPLAAASPPTAPSAPSSPSASSGSSSSSVAGALSSALSPPASPPPAAAKPAAPTPATSSAGQTSYCTSMETVVFSCRSGAKMVSVCASKDAGPNRGYVQYRFGKPEDPLELVVPESQLPPPRAAIGENVPFSGGGGTWMRFTKGQVAYTVYSGIGKWGLNGEIREKAGVVVDQSGKRLALLKCNNPKALGELGPVWFEKAGVKSGGKDFDFPD